MLGGSGGPIQSGGGGGDGGDGRGGGGESRVFPRAAADPCSVARKTLVFPRVLTGFPSFLNPVELGESGNLYGTL